MSKRSYGRALASVALTAGLMASLTACGNDASSSGDEEKLVIASWGGSFSKATKERLAKDFESDTGIEVQVVDAPGKFLASIESQKKAKKFEWDLLDSTSAPDAWLAYDSGLIAKMPSDLKKRLETKVVDGAVEDFGLAWSTLGYTVACQTEDASDCPANSVEYFDTEKFPGNRTSIATSPMVNLTLAELASGVSADEISTHEIDLDRAFAKLEELKPLMKVWWQSGDQMNQVFTSNEADLGIAYSGRAFNLDEQGTPMKVVWEQGAYNPGYWNVVEGSTHKEAAWKFIEWLADHPENAAAWAEDLSYSVPVKGAFDHMDEKTRAQMADLPENREKLIDINYEWYVKNADEVNARWQEFLKK
jgi:putative spermidine/putrescine transport system substrate-binding protein